MEDVFDLEGDPPVGWVHAIFSDGPYVDDVGRCVPGPPTPDPLPVSLPDGTTFEYRILSVLGRSLEDMVVLYAGSIPADSDPAAWWADSGGRWK